MSATAMFLRRAAIVRISSLIGLILVAATNAWAANARADGVRIDPGAGKFTFALQNGDVPRRMTVYTYLPAKLKADKATVVFVMHGQGKNADAYRDVWSAHADKLGFMVVAPLFDADAWGSAYASGQGLMRDGKPTDAAMWSFSVIEHLFDAIKAATGNKSATYRLYGHSEGGQFVHRLVWFLPEARYDRAVAANAGWYTMPDLAVALPYGLANSPATEHTLKAALERNLTVLLGSRDIDPNHSQLRKTPRAMAQGRYRLERGQNFFKQAGERCTALKCKFGWQLQIVPGAAHSNGQMAGAAAALLMEGK